MKTKKTTDGTRESKPVKQRTTALQKTLSRNTKALREEAGLTQRELSEMTGISQNHLSQIEVDARNVTIATVSKIARALRIPELELLGWKPSQGRREKLAAERQELLNELHRITVRLAEIDGEIGPGDDGETVPLR